MSSSQRHWESAYAHGDQRVGWRQDDPVPSLATISSLGLSAQAPIIDVGGGSSPLASALLDADYRDVSVLDLAPSALALARQRLGPRGSWVEWIAADVLHWSPPRPYVLWHDRALLHFFTDPADRRRYAETVFRALPTGGYAVITEAHGGTVHAAVAAGGGFEVVLRFPTRAVHRAPALSP